MHSADGAMADHHPPVAAACAAGMHFAPLAGTKYTTTRRHLRSTQTSRRRGAPQLHRQHRTSWRTTPPARRMTKTRTANGRGVQRSVANRRCGTSLRTRGPLPMVGATGRSCSPLSSKGGRLFLYSSPRHSKCGRWAHSSCACACSCPPRVQRCPHTRPYPCAVAQDMRVRNWLFGQVKETARLFGFQVLLCNPRPLCPSLRSLCALVSCHPTPLPVRGDGGNCCLTRPPFAKTAAAQISNAR
eukprot:SAG11_NODE_8151_length_1054_cov_1.571728_1_plen_242_part_01